MLVVFEVEELIMPLRDDAKGIFKKGNDNKKTADCWQVSIGPTYRQQVD